MTARIGDRIMIMSQEPHQPVREGEIREVRNDPGGLVYLVQWSDTGQESILPHGPDVVIMHRHGRGRAGGAQRLSQLRHPLEWRHNRDSERRQHVRDERLAWRVQDILGGLGLDQSDFSVASGRVVHVPEVISVADGPPVQLDIRILPGQTPDDFSAHAQAIAYDLGMAEVRVVPIGPSLIRLELVPHDPVPGHPPMSR